MNALDCSNKAATLKRRTIRPHHNEKPPRALCVVDPGHPEAAVALIFARVKAIRRSEGAGTFLFIDPAMNAYVINEQAAAAAEWAVSHWADFVGAYTPVRGHQVEGLSASLAGIGEDVRCHLADMARVPA